MDFALNEEQQGFVATARAFRTGSARALCR
jgi:hypothetical protein